MKPTQRVLPSSLGYLLSMLLPLGTLAFLMTTPHHVYSIAPVVVLTLVMLRLDRTGPMGPMGPMDRAPPVAPSQLFAGLLAALAILHIVNVVLLVYRVGSGLSGVDLATSVLLVGTCSAYSAVIVAHELVHKRQPLARAVGRVLLWTSIYDHFYVEHLRGHHAKVGTAEDPTTARFAEPFWSYARRSIVGQFASAWKLGRTPVALGLAGEALSLLAILSVFGTLALVAFFLQAVWASLLVTAVNYFDHYGLERSQRKVSERDAWDCDSALSQFSLLGLSRHADHHLRASRPFQELRATDQSPKLPHGYLRMALLVLFHSRHAQRLMTAELARKRLGPFGSASTAPGRPGGYQDPAVIP
jgi:alkane 1-monooxygenase